jgi:hypothetical protein
MANLSRKPNLPPSLSSLSATAKVATDEVRQVADYLAFLMEEIHGRSWRVHIEHEENVAFVMVVPRNDKRRASA